MDAGACAAGTSQEDEETMKTIEARCPVCGEWGWADPALIGNETTCPNCRQTVRVIPRTQRARARRDIARILIVAGGVILFLLIYEARVGALARVLGS